MGFTDISSLLGGIALFLFGMKLMGEGLTKVAGSKLEVILYKLTSNPIKGILLGTGVTAVIQSSSATSIMVVGFVNSGMMKVKQAIGIIMGAIIGTSVTGWIICLSSFGGSGIFEVLSTDTLTTLLAVIGIVLLMFTDKEQNHHIAYILLGFSVLMFGIGAMTDAVYPLRESETFINLLTTFSNPVIGVLIGLVFTSIIQSASAAVGILQTLAVTGAIDFKLALPILMGVAIGASVPVLLSALGANTNGKRTAFIYLMVDTLGVIIFSILFYGANSFLHFQFLDTTMSMLSIALLNTVFRAIIVLLLTPMIGLMEKIVIRIVKEKENHLEELKDVDRLEERFIDHPALAIEQIRLVINSMANISKSCLFDAVNLIDNYSDAGYKKTLELEHAIDIYEDKLTSYIVKVSRNQLNKEQSQMLGMYLRSITDYERIGDHSKNIAQSSKELIDRKIIFSEQAKHEIHTLVSAIKEICDITCQAFTNDNIENSHRIAPLEELIDNLCYEYKSNHIERMQRKECEYEHGFVFNDMLTDLERIGDHCSNIGITMRLKHSEISDRHGIVSKMKIEKDYDYESLYDEYQAKYEQQD